MATDPRDLVYTPSEIASIGSAYIRARRENKSLGIPIGLPSVDADFLPLIPGELTTIIARPGNGKTGFMMRWARERSAWLALNGYENKIVVYATWEQSIEELHAFDVAADTHISITDMARGNLNDDQMSVILAASTRRIDKPLWYIGHSMDRRKKRPEITVSAFAQALDVIEKWSDEKYEIDLVFIDYLQRIGYADISESKVIGLDGVLNRLKDGALSFGCPFVVGVQARREVDSKTPPIPAMDDGQWTSAVEQVSDKSISLLRPRKYYQEGEMFGKKSPVMIEGENQLLITILKQKMGLANKSYWAMFNPIYNQLDEAETRAVKL